MDLTLLSGVDDIANDLPWENGSPVRPARPSAPVHREKCPKCNGTGRYYGPSTHGHACFKCMGKGYFEFKTSPEQREQARAAVRHRKEVKLSRQITAFREANPEVVKWIDTNDGYIDFATSLSNALAKWGSLTANQVSAVHRFMAKAVERTEERKQIEAAAPTVNVTLLEDSFAKARDNGVGRPRLTMGDLCIKPAGPNSKNPGALYVTSHGAYLGKVHGGKFIRSRDCTPEQETEVVAFVTDPKAAAIAYGQRTGVCCVCNRQLTANDSIDNGIGPICAGKFGW